MNALRQTGLLIQWEMRRSLASLPLMVIVQALLAVATVIGFGFLVGDLTPEAALFLATGAPTITLIVVGLVMTPQQVGDAKKEGSLEWMHTLPVPRAAFLVADLVMWTVIALPGLVLAVLVGMWRYDLDLSPEPWLLGALLLVSLTAASVGYAMAMLLPPAVALLMSQALVFVILYFSPISYPASRMPEWMQSIHHWLPFEPMAQVVRTGLAGTGAFALPGWSVFVLVTWCAAAVLAAGLAVARRR